MSRDQFRKGIVWVDYWLQCMGCDREDVATVAQGRYSRGPGDEQTDALQAAKAEFKASGWELNKNGHWYCDDCKER